MFGFFFADREWIEKTIARNDKDGDGGISLEEFIEMNTKSRLARSGSKAEGGGTVATTLDKAKLAFNAYDRNRDGYLTKAELRKTSKRMTDAQIDAVFEKYDKDKVTTVTISRHKDFSFKSLSTAICALYLVNTVYLYISLQRSIKMINSNTKLL